MGGGAHARSEAVCREGRLRRLARASLLSAVALVLSYLEATIPLPVSLPGVKLGLANVAVAVALCVDGRRTAAAVALVKVVASGLLFGSPMMLAYSLGGTLLSFAGMALLSLVRSVGMVPLCMVGAILHNVGQLGVAALVLRTPAVFASLPPLAVAACLTGALSGSVAEASLASLQVVSDEAQGRPHVNARLDLRPGERVALVGANGSGKTGFALQLVRELGGCVVRDGRAAAGMVLQDPESQIVAPVVRDDVAFGPEMRGVPREEMLPLVREALAKAGLGESYEGREVSSLSGGERQRVAVAGLLALAPGLMVFDESTSMLDPRGRERFETLVDSLVADGVTVVQVTQLMDEAFSADRVALFKDGSIVAVRSPAELLHDEALLSSCGLELPPVARLARELRHEGIAAPITCDLDELADTIVGERTC